MLLNVIHEDSCLTLVYEKDNQIHIFFKENDVYKNKSNMYEIIVDKETLIKELEKFFEDPLGLNSKNNSIKFGYKIVGMDVKKSGSSYSIKPVIEEYLIFFDVTTDNIWLNGVYDELKKLYDKLK